MRGKDSVVAGYTAGQERRRASAESQAQLRQHAGVVNEKTVVIAADIAIRVVDHEGIAGLEHKLALGRVVRMFGRDKCAVRVGFGRRRRNLANTGRAADWLGHVVISDITSLSVAERLLCLLLFLRFHYTFLKELPGHPADCTASACESIFAVWRQAHHGPAIIDRFSTEAHPTGSPRRMSFPHIDLLYSASGLGVGFLVGQTGVGGGSLMTPLLVLLFGIHPATAVGTDLLYAAATKSVGTVAHGVHGSVNWRITLRLAAGSVPATLLTLLVLSRFDVMGPGSARVLSVGLG